MRPLTLVAAVLAGTVAAGLLWWLVDAAPVAPPDSPTPVAQPHVDTQATAAPSSDAARGRVEPTPAAPSASRGMRTPEGLSDHVTAWLRIVDAATNAPVPAAAVYRYSNSDEAAIAYSDANGVAALPLVKACQLIVARTGYLLRLAPTDTGSTAEQPQMVGLEPDRFSQRCVFQFRLPDGTVPDEVLVRFRPQRAGTADQPMPAGVRSASESVQQAWREQRTLAAVRAVPELHVQLGHANAAFVHGLAGNDEVAFVESGLFELDAATTGGFVARALFDTAAAAQQPLTVRLQPGARIRGHVRAENGTPVAGALVSVVGSDPLRLVARSGGDGAFAIGPLAAGVHGLEVRHRDYEIARAGQLSAGADDVTLTVTALPQSAIRGRVRAAGPGTALVGVRATVLDPVGQPVTTETDEEGMFALRASGTEALRLTIASDGYVPHSEFVTPGTGSLEVELWPRILDERRKLGLTGTITGVVLDGQGRPLAGLGVRFQPDQMPADWLPGRRVITGGRLAVPRMVTTGSDGAFELEVATAGSGVVQPVARDAICDPVRVEAVLGKDVANVRLTVRGRQ